MKIEQGRRVKMEYELGVEGGEVIESSASRGPIDYLHGSGEMLPGLERRIDGLEVGAAQEGVIPAAEAYGTEEALPSMTIPRSHFPSTEALEPGKLFEAKDPAGHAISFKVTEIRGDEVLVRLHHPLAGKNIRYRVKILDVSAPS